MEWYFDVKGKRIGPFSPEQIRGYINEGRVDPRHLVTADHLNGQWITVKAMLESVGSDEKPAPFQPPPRPDLDKLPPPYIHDATMEPDTDPALSLFEALQAVRERKASRSAPPAESLNQIQRKGGTSAGTWVIAALFVAFGMLAWGFIEMRDHLSDVASTPAKPVAETANGSDAAAIRSVRQAPSPVAPIPMRASGPMSPQATPPAAYRAPRIAPPQRTVGIPSRNFSRERDADHEEADRERQKEKEREQAEKERDEFYRSLSSDNPNADSASPGPGPAPASVPATAPKLDATQPSAGNPPPDASQGEPAPPPAPPPAIQAAPSPSFE